MRLTKYIDHYGLVRMETNTPTENGILFRAYLDWWKSLNGKLTDSSLPAIRSSIYEKDGEIWYQANPPEKGQHYSRDNMWGLYVTSLMAGVDIKFLPVFKWNGEVWWHPNGWMIFLALKSSFYRKLFHKPIRLMRWYSHKKYEKDPHTTSGRCLWAMVSWFLWTDLPDEQDIKAFRHYVTHGGLYNNPDHPILEQIKIYEENL